MPVFNSHCRSFKYSDFHNIFTQSLYEGLEIALLALYNAMLESEVENLVGNIV